MTLYRAFEEIPHGYIEFDVYAGAKPESYSESNETWERRRARVNTSPVFIMRTRAGEHTETDEISKRVNQARADLEAVCARYHDVNVFRQMLGIRKK